MRLLTAFACEASHLVVHGAHPRVVDGLEIGNPLLVVNALVIDLDDRHARDLLSVEETELNFTHFVQFYIGLGLGLTRKTIHFSYY